jgi:hypothetical protein
MPTRRALLERDDDVLPVDRQARRSHVALNLRELQQLDRCVAHTEAPQQRDGSAGLMAKTRGEKRRANPERHAGLRREGQLGAEVLPRRCEG